MLSGFSAADQFWINHPGDRSLLFILRTAMGFPLKPEQEVQWPEGEGTLVSMPFQPWVLGSVLRLPAVMVVLCMMGQLPSRAVFSNLCRLATPNVKSKVFVF